MDVKLRPSALPMLAKCSHFVGGGTDFAEQGTLRHRALHAFFEGDEEPASKLDEESKEAIAWASDYVRLHAPLSDFPIVWETRLSTWLPNVEPIEGTPDVVCGHFLGDFKWRPRDYTLQMAVYALMVLEQLGFPEGQKVDVHILFGATQYAQRLFFDLDSANRILGEALDRIEAGGPPTPCEYCGWCSKRLVCLGERAKTVAREYANDSTLELVNTWHPSEMEDPEQLSLGLSIWRDIVSKWGDSVEYHATKAALAGVEIPGFELKDRRGRRFVADVLAAYQATGLPSDEFLRACDVRLNTSATDPRKVGLDRLFMERDGLTQAAARKEISKLLGSAIATGKPSKSLVARKEP